MSTIKALVVTKPGKEARVADVPMPHVRDDWIIVKTMAVALNPTDWKNFKSGHFDTGSIMGCDYAGVVEEVGKNVTNIKKGDRVAGLCHGGNPRDHETGAFAEYVLAKAGAQIKIPDHLSFEQAATIPVSMFTCGLGLYFSLHLPLPGHPPAEPFPLLIHGGGTNTGFWGIQFAKASGLTVVTTASPHSFARLKALGADAVFDYHSPTCGADIKKYTQNKLQYAWDCAQEGEEICATALSDTEPSKYGLITRTNWKLLKEKNPLVEGPFHVLAYSVVGEPYEFPWSGPVVPSAEELAFAQMFKEVARDLLQKQTIRTPDISLNRGGPGLEGILVGLDELEHGKADGVKLVYTL